MEKKNLKANDYNAEEEIKKVQEGYINEMKAENGIVDVEEDLEDEKSIDELAKEKNENELERLKDLKRIKQGDRINYFMIDNEGKLREVSFKFPSTRIVMTLSEYGVSSDGRLFLDLIKSVEVIEKNKLFITKFDIENFCQEELEGFGGFLISLLRNPRKFIQDLHK